MGLGFFPLDEELALLPGQWSPALHAAVVRLGTWVPFERVPTLLQAFTRVTLSRETVRRLTEAAGAALVAAETAAVAQLSRDLPAPPPGPAVQHLSADGAMVPLLHGEWAEVKTLALGTGAPPCTDAGTQMARTTDVSYFSRLTDAATFGDLATLETHRRGTATAGTVVAVTDGAPWLQDFIDLQRPDAVRILDFPHAAEHLAQAAQASFGQDSMAATVWLDHQCHELKHGDPDQVLAALAALSPPTSDAARVRDQVHTYLLTRRSHIAYAAFQAAGYPISDGMVESANKLVVEARLKGSGMHWARRNVNPLVALRAAVCSDRWDASWTRLTAQRRQQCGDARCRRQANRQAALPPVTAGLPAPSAPPPVDPPGATHEAPLVVDGKPTADHPWRRFRLPGSRDFSRPAKS